MVNINTSLPDRNTSAGTFRSADEQQAADGWAGEVVAFRFSAKWLTGRPALGMALVGVVGVVAGAGVGFKVEQSRTHADVNRLKARISQLAAAPPGLTPQVKPSGVSSTRAGTVTAINASGFGVSTKKHRTFLIGTTKSTTFEQAKSGSKADIVVGRRVLVSISRTDVIVLPAGSRLGRLVTQVSGKTFSIKRAHGKRALTVPFSAVKGIDASAATQPSALEKGSTLLASGRAGSKGTFDAVEVILLPTGSSFAS